MPLDSNRFTQFQITILINCISICIICGDYFLVKINLKGENNKIEAERNRIEAKKDEMKKIGMKKMK